MDYKELVSVGTEIGRLLVQYGAEIYRAEESMKRIFVAYGAPDSHIFALTTCINVTVCQPDGMPISRICRVEDRCIDLGKIDRLNDLCRRACSRRPALSRLRWEVEQIEQDKGNSKALRALGFAGVAFAFTLFYGGNAADACVGAVTGLLVYWLQNFFLKYRANSFFATLLESVVIGLVCLGAAHFDPYLNVDRMIIGSVMNLVPGIAITSFMRDILSADYLSGLLRFVESLLVATAIALGVGTIMVLSRLLWGV
ncbi:threonine/serine exporter family protein [Caproicibacterium sp. ZCY20-5]|uniref:threonine/serine exporter family protein n=1 Tax=Caproicibacterium sp. XB1 TaxID=3396405 RepID=UPI0023D9A0BE